MRLEALKTHAEAILGGLLVFAALALFAYQGVSLLAPIVHEQHNWRQADVFSVAYAFHADGFDFFHPRIDFWRGPTGIVGMEAPVYPAIVHFFMYLLGDHPRTARIVSGLCFWIAVALAAICLSPRDAEPYTKKIRAACLLAAAAFSPMGLGEFRQIQPDGTAVSLTLAAAALCLLYSRTERPRWLAAAIVIYSLAAMTKSPVLVAGPTLWMLTFSEQPLRLRKMIARGLPFLVPLAAYFFWFRWAQQLTATYEQLNPYFNLQFDVKEVWGNLKNFGLYRHVFGFLIGSYAVNWVLLPAGVGGLLSAFTKEERRIGVPMAVWLFFSAFFVLAFAFRTTVHWYYAMVVFPPAIYFTGLGLANALELGRTAATTTTLKRALGSWVIFGFAAAIFAAGAAASGDKVPSADGPAFERTWFHARGMAILGGTLLVSIAAGILLKAGQVGARRPFFQAALLAAGIFGLQRAGHDALEAFRFRSNAAEWFTFDEKYAELLKTVEEKTTRADLFLVDGYQPFYLHLTRRRGFASDPGTATGAGGLSYYLQRGMKYYLHHAENPAIEAARRGRTPLAKGANFELYCIAADGCSK